MNSWSKFLVLRHRQRTLGPVASKISLNYANFAAECVKKTFPKGKLNSEFENKLPDEISSMEMTRRAQQAAAAAAAAPTPTPESQTPKIETSSETGARRRVDTSMDMFRNMARDIKRS